MIKVFDPEVMGMLHRPLWSLSQPDDLQRNPFQSTSVPNVRLYREVRVLAAEQGEGWKKREAPSKTRLKLFEAVALPEGLEHALERTGGSGPASGRSIWHQKALNGPAGLLNT